MTASKVLAIIPAHNEEIEIGNNAPERDGATPTRAMVEALLGRNPA